MPKVAAGGLGALTAAILFSVLREKGMILLSCGYYGNCIRLLAPLTIPKDHLNEGLDILCETMLE